MNKHNPSKTSTVVRKLVLAAIREHCKNDAALLGYALKMRNLQKFITAKRDSYNIDTTNDDALNMLIESNKRRNELIIAQSENEYSELVAKYSELVKGYVTKHIANNDTLETFFSYNQGTCPVTFMQFIYSRDYLLDKRIDLAFLFFGIRFAIRIHPN